MRKTALALFASFVVGAGTVAAAEGNTPRATGIEVGKRIPAFTAALLTPSGKPAQPAQLDSQRQERITAYVVIGTGCPASKAYSERLAKLERTFAPKQVDFVYVYPNREDTRETKVAFHEERKLGGRLVDDQGGKVARALGARRTSEVVLADRQGIIVYRGGIDDSRDANGVKQRYLETALDETLAGKPVTVAETPVQA